MSKISPNVLLDDQASGLTRRYQNPIDIIRADRPEQVVSAFEAIQSHHAQGHFIAGYAAYELGYALEPKLAALFQDRECGPLLCFGVFKDYHFQSLPEHAPSLLQTPNLKPLWSLEDYKTRFDTVIDYIKAGDVYQINLSFPMSGPYSGDAADLYLALRRRQPGRYGGIISLGGADIVSFSPELFFKTNGGEIDMHPMKGTARRMADPVQDRALRDHMQQDEKSRAENLMIVDLLRNDLSRIAKPGTVKVPALFSLETYPTLHQMTSHVSACLRQGIDIADIFKSLFPCGSITGAPKIRAMEIIHTLEPQPRGAYCGAMGYIDPGGEACFNVGIRTLTLDGGVMTYNVGSGIVLDSQAGDEYDECLLKAKVLTGAAPDLIETMRWKPSDGFIRADRHLARLSSSAAALNYPFSRSTIDKVLGTIAAKTPQRVRLALSPSGTPHVESKDFEPVIDVWSVSLSKNPLSEAVQETRYKVSHRDFYDRERRRVHALTDCDEVLFFNLEGALCEGSFTSVFIEQNGDLLTPHLDAGLLPGILREELIEQGRAIEAHLILEDLLAAQHIFIGNSLRGLIAVKLTDSDFH